MGLIQSTQRQRGDVMVIVLVLIVLVIVGGGGYWLWHKHSQPSTPAGSASSSSASTTNVAAAAGLCTALTLSQGGSNGTAGTLYKNAVVTNSGRATCTLRGYPAVFLLNAAGMVLGTGAASNPLYAVTTITLAPNGKAHTVLGFPDAGAFGDPSVCSAASSSLQVYVPGMSSPLTTPWTDQSCPGFSASAFQAGP